MFRLLRDVRTKSKATALSFPSSLKDQIPWPQYYATGWYLLLRYVHVVSLLRCNIPRNCLLFVFFIDEGRRYPHPGNTFPKTFRHLLRCLSCSSNSISSSACRVPRRASARCRAHSLRLGTLVGGGGEEARSLASVAPDEGTVEVTVVISSPVSAAVGFIAGFEDVVAIGWAAVPISMSAGLLCVLVGALKTLLPAIACAIVPLMRPFRILSL